MATTLISSAPRQDLERLHARVTARNMVLGALRGIPRTSELSVRTARAPAPPREAGEERAGRPV